MAAKTPVQIQDINARLQQSAGIVELPKVAAPFTTITKRALVTDLSNDLMPRLGIERFSTQQCYEAQGEYAGTERVFKVFNDMHEQVRFVGSWVNSIGNDGPSVSSSVIGDYVEVVFYGTGINVLMTNLGSDRGFTVFIDGVSLTTIVTTTSTILGGRGASPNQIFAGPQGRPLGLHTARFVKTTASGSNVVGFEIVNAAATLALPPGASYVGGKRLYKSALSTDSYNSNFESGILGARGGRVLVYQKADGTIGKALQATDAQLNLSATNHANEEMIRTYYWREFGANRPVATLDDFSFLNGSSPVNRAFTLEDGTTTLVGSSVGAEFESLTLFVNNTGFVTLTFVGTGLDIQTAAEVAGSTSYDVSVDGSSIGTLTNASTEKVVTLPIVSGLPYGTHVVKLLRTAATGSSPHIMKFIAYGPKKPTLPAGAVELANYYLMATFAANLTAGTNTIATGVLRKHATREMNYATGTWTPGLNVIQLGGWDLSSTTNPKSFSYTFFGTGFDIRWQTGATRTATATVSLNGVSLNNAYPSASSINCSVAGTGISYGAQTGSFLLSAVGASPAFDMQDASSADGNSFRVSNLPLGVYTLTVNDATTGVLILSAIDIITPVHFAGSSLPGVLQNAAPVGSMAIGDSRVFSDDAIEPLSNWAQSFGVVAAPTQAAGLTIPVPDMFVTVKTNGNPIEVSYSVTALQQNAAISATFGIYVDGVAVGPDKGFHGALANASVTTSDRKIIPVAPGTHSVVIICSTDGGSQLTFRATYRGLTVREI